MKQDLEQGDISDVLQKRDIEQFCRKESLGIIRGFGMVL
jgi:hypothetical protein